MRLRKFLALAVVAALAVPGAAIAAPPDGRGNGNENKPTGFKVTGGGQIVADETANGPGDTVGFVAQEIAGDDLRSTGDDDDAARGQFQYNPRGQGGDAAPAEKFHGVVTCLISGGEAVENEANEGDDNVEEALAEGMARFGGYLRDDPTVFFTVDVTDNGQGENSSDAILVRLTGEPCADNPENEDEEADELVRLGRGNVKIHNNPDDETSATARATRAATALR